MTLFVTGVSHKTAPVEVREQLAVQRNEPADLAHYLKWFGHFDEMEIGRPVTVLEHACEIC